MQVTIDNRYLVGILHGYHYSVYTSYDWLMYYESFCIVLNYTKLSYPYVNLLCVRFYIVLDLIIWCHMPIPTEMKLEIMAFKFPLFIHEFIMQLDFSLELQLWKHCSMPTFSINLTHKCEIICTTLEPSIDGMKHTREIRRKIMMVLYSVQDWIADNGTCKVGGLVIK